MSEHIFHIPVMDLMLTSKCNMRCKYCFEAKKIQKNLEFEEIKPYLDQNGSAVFFLFGGEPFMNSEFLKEIYDYIENTDIPSGIKDTIHASTRKIITNGTLTEKYVELIKKYNLNLQISLDGPKEVHDLNRIKPNGEGSWDKVMDNIYNICLKHKIKFSIHGVITKETLPKLYDISKFFFEKNYEFRGKEKAIGDLKINQHQIIFEEDYTDTDIDVVLSEIIRFCDYLWYHPKLTQEEKRKSIYNYLTKQGGVCGAGTALMAVDHNLDIYPCHRQADNSVLDKETAKLGKIYENHRLKNFGYFNTFFRVNKIDRVTYSTKIYNHGFESLQTWLNWCPSTNAFTSGVENPYYINSKYAILHLEIHRLGAALLAYYKIPPGGLKSGNTR